MEKNENPSNVTISTLAQQMLTDFTPWPEMHMPEMNFSCERRPVSPVRTLDAVTVATVNRDLERNWMELDLTIGFDAAIPRTAMAGMPKDDPVTTEALAAAQSCSMSAIFITLTKARAQPNRVRIQNLRTSSMTQRKYTR
eukprot:1562421-Pleurochrysis_carterae.AAC.6